MTDADLMRTALALIGTGCERHTNHWRCVERTDMSPYAKYTDDRWCNGCIAWTALNGTEFPSRGANPNIEEVPA